MPFILLAWKAYRETITKNKLGMCMSGYKSKYTNMRVFKIKYKAMS